MTDPWDAHGNSIDNSKFFVSQQDLLYIIQQEVLNRPTFTLSPMDVLFACCSFLRLCLFAFGCTGAFIYLKNTLFNIRAWV